MTDLLIIMFERVGTIIAVAFILTRFSFFKNMMRHDTLKGSQEIKAILFFAMFGIAGTYLGFTLNIETLQFNSALQGVVTEEAIANSRVIGVVIAGLLGGYRVGLSAGLIAGIHRMTLGGFTAISCGISTIIAGFLSSYFYKKNTTITPTKAFLIGGSAEMLQMGIILLISKPFDNALALVEVIGLPMILANGFGTAIFMLIIQSVVGEERRVIASEAEKTLRIADQTISHLRQGLTPSSAKAVCTILQNELHATAVAMTNKTHVLAHVGALAQTQVSSQHIQSEETKEVLDTGIICNRVDDHLYMEKSAIIAPLFEQDRTIGTLKVYYNERKASESIHVKLIQGLSKLISEQLEIGEAERMFQIAKEAEVNALQAQVNPHFLFNSINIINSLIRTNPDEARRLLTDLSTYIRKNVTGITKQVISLREELAHVKAYVAIVEARFIDRLNVQYALDFSIMDTKVPPFTLQPLVENAITHGFQDKDRNCSLYISMQQKAGEMYVEVTDNGKGIEEHRQQTLLEHAVTSEVGAGIGLYNVNRRLIMLFGEEAKLNIQSTLGEGTSVSFKMDTKEDEDVSSNHS